MASNDDHLPVVMETFPCMLHAHRSSIPVTLLTDTTPSHASSLVTVGVASPDGDVESVSRSMAAVTFADVNREEEDGEEEEEEEERDEDKEKDEDKGRGHLSQEDKGRGHLSQEDKGRGHLSQEDRLNMEAITPAANPLSSPGKILHAFAIWTTAMLESGESQDVGGATKDQTIPSEVGTKREVFLPPVHSISVTQVQRNIFMGQLKRRYVYVCV